MSTKRQLSAIMFTDIVGYTALMHQNEAEASRVRQRHRSVLEAEHERFHGEILQYYGDGTLSIFKSAVEAVECAIAMQQQFATGQRVPLRIGIHLGDIVIDGVEVYGDGVNLASRVESLGVPGSILISDKLKFAVKNQSGILTKSLGIFELKNIEDPVEIYAVANSDIQVPDRSELKGKLKQTKKSVAVLPFVNMSSDPENEYFSDGISEEILNALVRVEGLSVTARTSSFAFKGKNLDVREIGTQLGVANILEGSVRKSGDRVRITAQLVSTVDGYHHFSETYDRMLDDIFNVQDEIASTITNRLREHLGKEQHEEKMIIPSTDNIEAYETYLRGLFYANQFGDDAAMWKAIPYFEKAIAQQPNFVLPYEKLSICYIFSAFSGKIALEEVRSKMTGIFERLNELGIASASGYFACGVYNIFITWDFSAAAEAAREGLKKFPNAANLYHIASTLHWIKGDLESTVRTHKIGLDLDPLSIEMILYMGVAHLWNGEIDQAIPYFEKVLVIVPQHRAAKEYTGWVAAFKRQYKEALDVFETLEPFGYRFHRSTCMGWAYVKLEAMEEAEACLEELLTLHNGSPEGFGLCIDLAVLYTCMNNFDRAFFYLEKAITHKVGSIMMFSGDPLFQPLKGDPRFEKMVALVGEVPVLTL